MKKIKVTKKENGSVRIVCQGLEFIVSGTENGIAIVMPKDRPIVLSSGHPNLIFISGLDKVITKAVVKTQKSIKCGGE